MVPTLEQLAKQISTDLYNSRKKCMSSPDNPVISDTICKAYKEKYNWEIESREVRAATKFLVENNIPIGTTLEGCYYVMESKEWNPTLDMLMPKFLSMKSKIDSIQQMQKEMASKEAGQQEIPLMKILDEKLGLERI